MKRRKSKPERFQWPRQGVCDDDITRTSIVQVDWFDAQSYGAWERNDKDPGLVFCTSVGFLLRKAERHITLAASFSVQNSHGDAISIPRQWIKRIRVLQRAPQAKVKKK